MKGCWDIKNCTAREYLNCPSKQGGKNCWENQEGCLCERNSELVCEDCIIYKEHRIEQTGVILRVRDHDDQEAFLDLFKYFKRYIYQIVKNFSSPGFTLDDLAQEGSIGLFSAIKNFDETRKSSFEGYVSRCIKNSIIAAVRKGNRQNQMALNRATPIDEERDLCVLPPTTIINPEEEILAKIEVISLNEKIRKNLSALERKILGASVNGFSHDEISTQFKMKQKQIENAIFRARKKIMKNMVAI